MIYQSSDPKNSTGNSTYHRILTTAQHAIDTLSASTPLKLGRVRGTGPGVSFGSLIDQIEATHPLALKYPFEGSDRVGGAVWHLSSFSPTAPGLQSPTNSQAAIAKLRWLDHAGDLPIHAHEHSDRFIVVLEGRGFFHWTDQSQEEFNGSAVETIAARSRDVFVFRRGLLHTFSTEQHSMTLLSVQMPYFPFDDPRQYSLPEYHWTVDANAETPSSRIACMLQAPETSMHL